MVEATVALKNGKVMTVFADSFTELFARLAEEGHDIKQVVGKTIRLKDLRQGMERLQV